MGYLATESQADYEYIRNIGQERSHQAWILSDRDVWYENPFYCGPKVPHPEDYEYEQDQECETYQYTVPVYGEDQEIPF